MLVRKIKVHNFMRYDDLELELPDRGIVLVTGPNGSGKSSLQEAVSMAYWGKTLRKTPPWRKDKEGSVLVDAGTVAVTRKCTAGGKVSVSWTGSNKTFDKRKYNTPTKAQAALDAFIMQHDLWRRTHVFSPSMASNFTAAKDSERKRLIEAFLGLSMFDAALGLCREDLKTARTQFDEADRRTSMFESQVMSYESQRDQAQESLTLAEKMLNDVVESFADIPTPEQLEKLDSDVQDLRRDLGDSQGDLREVAVRMQEVDRTVREAMTRLTMATDQHGALTEKKCPTCGQDIPKETRDSVNAQLNLLRQRVEATRATAAAEAKQLEVERDDLNEEVSLLRTRVEELSGQLAIARDRVKKADPAMIQARKQQARDNVVRCEQSLAQLEQQIAKLRNDQKQAVVRKTEAESRVEFLKVVERVLGLRGVRVQVLGHALEGINDLSSYWLAKITNNPEASICLKPYSETKTAGINDALSIVVGGFGGGYGYDAASTGEKRRIDVPITMAMATVADSALGVPQGTLWMDEIFDNLDAFGIDAVGDALEELALERPVVVISHSLNIVSKLRPVMHINVDAGNVRIK